MSALPILLTQTSNIDEVTKLGFTFAKEAATTLITLSTGLLTLSVTFAKDVLKSISKPRERVLKAAWGVHVGSIIFGVWTLLALTGDLMPVNPADRTLFFGINVRGPAMAQIGLFVLGTGLLAGVYWGKHQETKTEFKFLQTPISPALMDELKRNADDGWDVVSITAFGTANEYVILLKKAKPA